MKRHVLIINTKAYKEGTGENALNIAGICKRLSKKTDVEIILSVQPSDIRATSGYIKTFAQHIDAISPGSHTGHILPESVKAAGASGTLLNHSERRLDIKEIKEGVRRAREVGLQTVCCVPYTNMVSKITRINPDYIAIEPPELIGTGISVSKAKPYVIEQSVEIARSVDPGARVLCGAGISTGEDVSASIELGATGVLLASSVVKSDDPENAIKEILRGFS